MKLSCGHEIVACPSCGSPPSASSSAPTHAPTSASVGAAHVVALVPKTSTTNSNYEDPFWQEFWNEYPRKVGKKPARRAWDQALKAGASPRAIIDAAKLYALMVQRNRTEARHIKYPAGWLNDERFYDELEEVQQATDAAWIVGTPEYAARVAAEEQRAIEAMS